MPSKLKLRRQRRLREDIAWWRAEAMDCKARLLELAKLLEEARRQRVPMPVLVPAPIMKLVAPATSEPEICLKCNDGARLGCSSCAYRLK
ncbi:hypothetical protein SAMN05216168_4544 [Kosakonia radicincitans]|uniref:hypothetical protein n=1 Tax=Kosakonia radicincitans TaxID=283686 RepID=UPI0009A55F43|nr:hypothetical protein [Kosakonia radicincitans]SKC22509.1 hypothetical protein SAMN05216168_4544 [Kosakonia radicincitans]